MSKKVFAGDIVTVRDRSRGANYQVRPAIVTAVNAPDSVDVSVFAEGGITRELIGMREIDPHKDDSLGWHWPLRD